jgi:hypothetical protein
MKNHPELFDATYSEVDVGSGPFAIVWQQFATDRLYANNLFVTSWGLFCELCELWFNYLARFADRLTQHDPAPYNRRDIAFLSERTYDTCGRCRESVRTEIIELPIFYVT